MATRIITIHEAGFDGLAVEVECHSSNGLPGIIIVGLANKAVEEAKERIRSAFVSSGLSLPKKRLTLNLAPADEPKESAALDLAMALSIVCSHGTIQPKYDLSQLVFFGELSLDGRLRPVRGILGKILYAKKSGYTAAIVPSANAAQAALISGINIYSFENLAAVIKWLYGETTNAPEIVTNPTTVPAIYDDFKDVIGHSVAKRALEIAAAGGHNILLNGPPGTGKSMLAKAMPSILPPLTIERIIEVTHLHSLVDRDFDNVITSPPFRAPHHSAISVSIIGGGTQARPGEISLAHGGVLFMDELPEFHRDCLEALRQPLEDHTVQVARAKRTITYPANFILVATKNPCPCGYFGSDKHCRCSASDVLRYNKKLSGPILDRIDIHTEVEEIPYQLLSRRDHHEEASADIRARVMAARDLQLERNPSKRLNNELSNRHFNDLNLTTSEATEFLTRAAESLGISARSFVRTLRLSRTIADLEASPQITKKHIAEALQYRPKTLEL